MPIEHSDALVLRSVEFSETSLILTLFTREFGKIHGIAKGGRRLKNPFETSLDVLAHIFVSFIRKNSDSLDLLTEAKLIRRFRPNRANFAGLNAGYYLVELLGETTDDGDPSPELFDLAEETLVRFQAGSQIHKYLIHFECGLLELSGRFPSTRFCVECGEPAFVSRRSNERRNAQPPERLVRSTPNDDSDERERVSFSFLDGGVLCPRCRFSRSYSHLASVSTKTLALLERMRRDDFKDIDSFEFGDVPTAIRGEIRGLLNHYISHSLGKKLNMTDHFDQILPFDR